MSGKKGKRMSGTVFSPSGYAHPPGGMPYDVGKPTPHLPVLSSVAQSTVLLSVPNSWNALMYERLEMTL
eukprot:CAMPEP_0206129316 /NCGR_PEP_ID=MMETSP1472-20131121/35747_1 /ASSEMBLY_ACC=CAM_ASM_001108 /TAXON_ID=41880 /ORGANISM="Pycnococcus provasolii, Strain RCC251" /LENGTH=68 /DNA_ID=CAMNT_0053520561 /DNA_START=486 /DNA_END=692 /DNA_ORIENTATION=+